MMHDIVCELRILLAERLFALAVAVMPERAGEATHLKQAHAIYLHDVGPLSKWEKFPA